MAYLESVDNALRLLTMLSRDTRVGVSDVAEELGVAPSTAHRLLSTFRYRGFVLQAEDRSYAPGPAFTSLAHERPTRSNLIDVAQPHLESIRRAVDETCHLVVLSRREARFLASAETQRALRVSSRTGQVMPAHLASGGKVLLAHLAPRDLAALYPAKGVPAEGVTPEAVELLGRELAAVHRRNYAVNAGATERGIAAIAVAIRSSATGAAVAALSISVPTVRYSSGRIPELLHALRRAADGVSEYLGE